MGEREVMVGRWRRRTCVCTALAAISPLKTWKEFSLGEYSEWQRSSLKSKCFYLW